MNREDVIRMAREAGLYTHPSKQQVRFGLDEFTGDDSTEKITRFAKLAAEWGAKQEREACAKVCDDHNRPDAGLQQGIWVLGTAVTLAAAIRARGET